MRNRLKKIKIEPKSGTAILPFSFFDSSLSTCANKMVTGKWAKVAMGKAKVTNSILNIISDYDNYAGCRLL